MSSDGTKLKYPFTCHKFAKIEYLCHTRTGHKLCELSISEKVAEDIYLLYNTEDEVGAGRCLVVSSSWEELFMVVKGATGVLRISSNNYDLARV